LFPTRFSSATPPRRPDDLSRGFSAIGSNFFTLWKDADPDISIRPQAMAEHAKLLLPRASLGSETLNMPFMKSVMRVSRSRSLVTRRTCTA
jgi:hypothetical protein